MKIKHRFAGEVLFEVPGDTLRGADLSGADLSGAALQRVDLRGANLRGVRVIFAGIDSRSYEFYLTASASHNDIVIRAGCRRWDTFAEARAHFGPEYTSNGDVSEIMAKLDYLETVAKARGYIS